MDRKAHTLTAADMAILAQYVARRNRELYWNYLARLPGNDGYGLLALGVVRNDNMPGKTGNAYAARYALEHNHKVLTEREWENFGVDLIALDLAERKYFLEKDGRPDLALNLPALNVQKAHDTSFKNIGVDPDAWTPRKLLERARQHDGNEERVEKLWSAMLDNGYYGAKRAMSTFGAMAEGIGFTVEEKAVYAATMGGAYIDGANDRSLLQSHLIGETGHYYARDRTGAWSEVEHVNHALGSEPFARDVTNPRERERLEETYQLREERARTRDEFLPGDRPELLPSPQPLAGYIPRSSFPTAADDPVYAAIRLRLPLQISDDKVAELTVAARRTGLRREDQLEKVHLLERNIVLDGTHLSHGGMVSRETPAPPKEESIALAQQLDVQAIEARQLAMQQERVMSRGRGMSM